MTGGEADGACDLYAIPRPSGLLRISVATDLASITWSPALSDFLSRFPRYFTVNMSEQPPMLN